MRLRQYTHQEIAEWHHKVVAPFRAVFPSALVHHHEYLDNALIPAERL